MLMKESGEFYLVSRACQDKIMHCIASGSKAVESVDGAKRNETDSIVTLNVKMKDLAPGSRSGSQISRARPRLSRIWS